MGTSMYHCINDLFYDVCVPHMKRLAASVTAQKNANSKDFVVIDGDWENTGTTQKYVYALECVELTALSVTVLCKE